MKLISMTDFVLEQRGDNLKYAQFLKQSLNLGMFVPCDLEGNVLQDPGLIPSYELQEYRKYKERVLFEGTEEEFRFIINRLKNNDNLIIDNLTKNTLTLTKSAQKKLGL